MGVFVALFALWSRASGCAGVLRETSRARRRCCFAALEGGPALTRSRGGLIVNRRSAKQHRWLTSVHLLPLSLCKSLFGSTREAAAHLAAALTS